VRDIIRQRRIGERKDDLLEMLISARDEDTGQSLTDKEIRDEVMTLILAGHETTANLLSWTCYLLSRHPEIEQRMRSEILQESGKNAVGKGEISQLQFTRNVLQEVLRLYPPVWIISRKAIEEDSIGGYRIPAGAIVTLSSYALHRHPVFWEHPEEFIPGRFSNVKGKLKSDAYFPFGGGPRSCIGSHFAMTEALQAISMIYARFHLRIAGEIEVKPEPLVTLRPRDGLRMVPVRI
jgi:cytochrome P450